ncbi:E3 SUMO-protein ligase ZBED1-like [Cyprinodon tularosa]|uniref:E3 SUMO-protein ligase ZBED1-like n=1 Tax=Cyprinodon tularosa TaxID=77115 RepID=UPI0018E24524|nr:E3 SUMO-protein ligase ZBED1-like [Cyprinodon tularosa]
MTNALNPRYTPPSRTVLSNTLIPAWYEVEKQNVITELANVSKVAITSDGWTSLAQDHYITVTAHYSSQGKLQQKVLRTKAVYRAQTGETVAVEIGEVLEEFGITQKVVVMTVDNASNMDVAAKKLDILKLGCFAHTLNLAAQKVYSIAAMTRWAAKLRAVIVWMKRSSMAKVVLKEKQLLLKLPQHTMILDVKTRWNSLFLMVERFLEQYPALQAAVLDPRIRKPMERDRLDRITDEDFTKAEEFIKVMKVLYTSTLCVSSEKTPTCGQILPILMKLKTHFTVQEGDSSFVSDIKRKVLTDLSGRYQEEKIQQFLEEATAMDPRFKAKSVRHTTWERLQEAAVATNATEADVPIPESHEDSDTTEEAMYENPRVEVSPPPQPKKSALEELFAEEEQERRTIHMNNSNISIQQRVCEEIQLYRSLPMISIAEDPVLWWWTKRDTLPLLADLSHGYLTVQASSSPSERVFSTAGDTISQERSRIMPDKADMLIFLQKNTC